MALSQGMKKHDGSMLLRIADLLASRDDKGHYTDNSAVAIIAINCLDYPVQGDKTTWANQAKELTQAWLALMRCVSCGATKLPTSVRR